MRCFHHSGISRSNSVCSDIGDDAKFVEGDRVVAAGFKKGTIRFIGETKFAPGQCASIILNLHQYCESVLD